MSPQAGINCGGPWRGVVGASASTTGNAASVSFNDRRDLFWEVTSHKLPHANLLSTNGQDGIKNQPLKEGQRLEEQLIGCSLFGWF